MNVIHVDETNFDRLCDESRQALKDFLFMIFEITGDCGPVGDWDRAELGGVDPFKYLDISYDGKYPLLSDPDLQFLQTGAALNLLCRLAQIAFEDECSGSTWLADFRNRRVKPDREALIREYHPELYRILDAFECGRIVSNPVIQDAFKAVLHGPEDFHRALQAVTSEVLLRLFQDRITGSIAIHPTPNQTRSRTPAAADDHPPPTGLRSRTAD